MLGPNFPQASCWGGYVYAVNLIALHALTLVALGRFSPALYVAFAPAAVLATLLFASVPIIGRKALTSGALQFVISSSYRAPPCASASP